METNVEADTGTPELNLIGMIRFIRRVAGFPFRLIIAAISEREKQVSEVYPPTGIQIICGNCAGVDPLPRKTYMTRTGRCAECGSSSFVNAGQQAVEKRAHQLAGGSTNGGHKRTRRKR